MKRILIKNWFFIGIAGVIAAAFAMPSAGKAVREFHILKIGIFLAFLVTGLTLETSAVLQQLRRVRVLAAALVSSLVMAPLLAWGLSLLFFGREVSDGVIGACIIGAAPVTIASGTVMTALALGNVPLSLFICVLGNLGAIVTLPLMLNLMLRFGTASAIDLPVLRMLMELITTVLIPTVIGQVLRPRLKTVSARYQKQISIFNQCVVLLIIFNAVSSSTNRIMEAGMGIIGIAGVMAGLHFLILAMNYLISRLIRLDLPSTAAFTIHVSQKTLTVSYLVWAGYFADRFPMGLLGPIAYHLTQMIADTIVAERFRAAAESRIRRAEESGALRDYRPSP